MSNDFTSKEGVQKFFSGFWTQLFDQRSFVEGVSDFHALTTRQVYQDVTEVINSISPETIPLYHLELVRPFRLNEKDLSVGPLPITYGEGIVIGEQPIGTKFRAGEIFEFGGKERRSAFYYFPVPAKIKEGGSVLTNRLVNPSVLLMRDLDFVLGDGIIAFLENPFENPDLVVQEANGERYLVLWGTNIAEDKEFVSTQFTFGFASTTQSLPWLKSFAKALLRLRTGGPTIAALDSFVAASAELPVTEIIETVESIETFRGETLVITDKNVYPIPSGMRVRSEHRPGVILPAGTPLTETTRVDDLISNPAWWKSRTGLMLSPALQAPGHALGPIFFPNKDVVVTPVRVAGGHVSARFELLGDAKALESFWEYVDSGVAGVYLGEELWRVENLFTQTHLTFIDGDIVEFINGDICTRILKEGWIGVDDETMLDFFSHVMINPMGFLVERIFGHSMVSVQVNGSLIPSLRRFLFNMKSFEGGLTPIALPAFFIDYTVSDGYVEQNTTEQIDLGLHLEVEEEVVDLAEVAHEDFLLVKSQLQH